MSGKATSTTDFQTPAPVAKYMVQMIPAGVVTVLEPTPGRGNLIKALGNSWKITAPDNFFELPPGRFDCVVMNPPFSRSTCYGIPEWQTADGMALGYWILSDCMRRSDDVIALMPWFTISDSDVRLRSLMRWGLISVTALPRKTFAYTRVQTVVLQLQKGWQGTTAFKAYDLRDDHKVKSLI
jgi:hypothetical protein